MAPQVGVIDPGQHLSFSDIAVDDVSNPEVLSIRIKQDRSFVSERVIDFRVQKSMLQMTTC